MKIRFSQVGICVASFILALFVMLTFFQLPSAQAAFSDSSFWETFDYGSEDGYQGVVYDGRYVYFVPSGDVVGGSGRHGEVLRYDTYEDFSTSGSWAVFDPGAQGLGTTPDGYTGGVFDGRYVYFAPQHSGSGYHGEVLRYDTHYDFDVLSSWTIYNIGTYGYSGIVYDGRYLYFSPLDTVGAVRHGRVQRYDTQGDFETAGSWTSYDPGNNGVGTDPDGFRGIVYDGRYVYFVPNNNGTSFSGEVLRYDTQGTFNTAGSWAAYDPNDDLLGTDPVGFTGGTFDGRYIYFAPYNNTSGDKHGEVLRYDTQGTFTSSSSWDTYDAGVEGSVGTDPVGYTGVVNDGDYLYFMPNYNDSAYHDEVLRYNLSFPFGSATSWDTYKPSDDTVGTFTGGYYDGGFDGQYVYFSPSYTGSAPYSEVLRYNTGNKYPKIVADTYVKGATNVLYKVKLRPLIPWEDGTEIAITFPADYATDFANLVSGDISVTGTNVSSTAKSFNTTTNTLSITITTNTNTDVVSEVIVTIGDGVSGGLNDLDNPDVVGSYTFLVETYDTNGSIIQSDYSELTLTSGLDVSLLVKESMIMSYDQSNLSFSIDPAVNGGRDVSQYSEFTVSSNALSGYSLYGKLDDGSGNAQLVNGSYTISTGTGENNFGYEAKNAAYDGSEVVNADASFASTLTVLNSNGSDIALSTMTNEQKHTVYYEIDVDFLTDPGHYTGVLTYTIIGSF